VLAARHAAVPLVSLEMVLPAGGQHDPLGRAGLSTLTAAVIDEGTHRRSALEIAAHVERFGGSLTTGADWDVGYLGVGLLAQHRTAGLEILGELLHEPTFPQAEVERLVRQRTGDIVRRSQDPSILAEEKLSQVLFAGTPFAHPLIGTQESIEALDREAIVAFYSACYTPRGAALIAVGDLDPEAVLREIEAIFGAAGGEPPPAPAIRAQLLPGVAVHVVDRPDAPQTELRVGQVGISRRDPDYVPLVVLNTLLGGKFTSRINMNLRERNAFTYGASSRFVARLQPGPFIVDAAVATESAGAAAREVLAELRRIREEPVEPDELEETRSYIDGVFPYTFQTIGDIAKRLETLATYGLPDDYYARYLERLAALTREELLAVAQQHLDPDHSAVVAVGPAETLVSQLAALGPVTVWPRPAAG